MMVIIHCPDCAHLIWLVKIIVLQQGMLLHDL